MFKYFQDDIDDKNVIKFHIFKDPDMIVGIEYEYFPDTHDGFFSVKNIHKKNDVMNTAMSDNNKTCINWEETNWTKNMGAFIEIFHSLKPILNSMGYNLIELNNIKSKITHEEMDRYILFLFEPFSMSIKDRIQNIIKQI